MRPQGAPASAWRLALLLALAPAAAAAEPSYRIAADGTVDYATYKGYLRYGEGCLSCHGPDGLGSSFGPSLVESLKTMPYAAFVEVVTAGKSEVDTARQLSMPPFAGNRNVMCFLDAIYAYLKARSDGALGRGRPARHEPPPPDARQRENACLGFTE